MGGRHSSLVWDADPFAEGSTRWAFRACVEKGTYEGYPKGTELVVKVIKNDCFDRGIRLTEDDIAAQILTMRYCELFNERNFANKRVFGRAGRIVYATEDHYDSNGTRNIAKGEAMLLEQYIHGSYEKFNSNTGWSDENIILPNFFSHWTWVESKERHLVCDLQGHRGRPGGPKYGEHSDYYVFTDPVVMTNTAEGLKYGCSDLGKEGIVQWFERHNCNELCKAFNLEDKRPDKRPKPKPRKRIKPKIERVLSIQPFTKSIEPDLQYFDERAGKRGTQYRPRNSFTSRKT